MFLVVSAVQPLSVQLLNVIGDKVIALDGEGQNTLKTLLYDTEQSRYYLHPENHMLRDIYVDELTVQGVVRFIIKKG